LTRALALWLMVTRPTAPSTLVFLAADPERQQSCPTGGPQGPPVLFCPI
jgi:hypothetical protein